MEPWVNLGNIFKEQLDHIHDSDEAEYNALKKVVWELYKTAYRLQPSVDVTANLAGLYAMERNWEYAALVAEKSLAIQYTEEAFCVLMKALDNICNWEHPMRDMPRLIAILERNVRDAARARALSIAYHTSTVCPRGANSEPRLADSDPAGVPLQAVLQRRHGSAHLGPAGGPRARRGPRRDGYSRTQRHPTRHTPAPGPGPRRAAGWAPSDSPVRRAYRLLALNSLF